MRNILFNAGPAALPETVLQQAAQAMLEIPEQGQSIAEISHRSQFFENVLEEFKQVFRRLLNIPDSHDIILMQGGARLQFALIPLNFLPPHKTAAFIDSGYWAKTAWQYAEYGGKTECLASSQEHQYRQLPHFDTQKINTEEHAYLYLCSNNTIYGTQYHTFPKVDIPLIIDMSSDILSKPINFTNIDLAFACAQKNIGPAGFSVLIVKKDFLQNANTQLAPSLSYKHTAAKHSNDITNPVVAIYIALLNLRHLEAEGGVTAAELRNTQKAKTLYAELDRNSLFTAPVLPEHRSAMNVCFFPKKEEHQNAFLEFCSKRHIKGLKGHVQAGGFRASLYNAVTQEMVNELIQALHDFETEFA
ncbi:MAG: 3-phosphoserine/phosphohydroxythreonine transaminase [Chitinophagaceae bacterium]